MSYERQRSVLRVIQEALMNVFRHAKATVVKVAIEATDTHFKLRIDDNGSGMPIGQVRSGARAISLGVGIPAMRARVQQMGGTLEIRSSSASDDEAPRCVRQFRILFRLRRSCGQGVEPSRSLQKQQH